MAKISGEGQDYCSNKNAEVQPANRQTPSVRLNLKLGKLPNRKKLGDPYKGR